MANVACSGSATPEVGEAEQEALDARTAYFPSDGIRSLLPPCGFDRLVLPRKTTHYGIDILRLSQSHRASTSGRPNPRGNQCRRRKRLWNPTLANLIPGGRF